MTSLTSSISWTWKWFWHHLSEFRGHKTQTLGRKREKRTAGRLVRVERLARASFCPLNSGSILLFGIGEVFAVTQHAIDYCIIGMDNHIYSSIRISCNPLCFIKIEFVGTHTSRFKSQIGFQVMWVRHYLKTNQISWFLKSCICTSIKAQSDLAYSQGSTHRLVGALIGAALCVDPCLQ